jgi:hypothetical protein
MSLTSLGIASNGLLDRGGNPALHIASMGLLRSGVTGRRGGGTPWKKRRCEDAIVTALLCDPFGLGGIQTPGRFYIDDKFQVYDLNSIQLEVKETAKAELKTEKAKIRTESLVDRVFRQLEQEKAPDAADIKRVKRKISGETLQHFSRLIKLRAEQERLEKEKRKMVQNAMTIILLLA